MVKTTNCPVCGTYKKPWYDLCFECNKKGLEAPSQKEIDVKETKKNASQKFKGNNEFPTHTELYRDLHLIEKDIVKEIFKTFGWTFKGKTFWSIGKKETKFIIRIEEQFWDLVIGILDTPEKNSRNMKKMTSSAG